MGGITLGNIRIVSNGTPTGTKVYAGDTLLSGVNKIVIHPITSDNFVTADITFFGAAFDIACWEVHPLKQWANKKVGK